MASATKCCWILLMIALCVFFFPTESHAQTFTAQPAASISLTPGETRLASLECEYTVVNDNDVIGWVVDTTRISNDGTKDSESITSALGPEAVTQLSISHVATGSGFYTGIDFYGVTPAVAGDYKCQLCTNDGSDGCGNVLLESDVSEVRVEYEPSGPPTCRPPSTTSTRVILGEAVVLSCTSEPGLPVVQLEWYRETELISGDATEVDRVLYNNISYTPEASDTGLGLICRMTTASLNSYACSASPFFMVSTPVAYIQQPDPMQIPLGSSGTYTCVATSPTNTAISSYVWTLEDISSDRVTEDGNMVTISSVTTADHNKKIQCEVTDAENMQGTAENVILVAGEVVPSNLPTRPPVPSAASTTPSSPSGSSTTAQPPAGFPLAAIIVIAVVGVVLICILLASIWFLRNKKKKQQKHIPPTVVKNNLSPTSASPFNSEKAFAYPNVDPRNPDPDVIPKGMNERPVDVKAQWRETGQPDEYSPTIKSVNMPFQYKGSRTELEHDPYNYNPAYDDKVDPADLDFKVPLDDRDYSDSGIGYRDGDNGYPDEKYGKQYNDVYYNSDGGYDERNYEDRQYGDGHQDPYTQNYGDPYNGDYGRVYDDDDQVPPAHYGSGYDAYPDRMPDGSEGYEPPPEEYGDHAYDAHVYNAPTDYGRPSDYDAPLEYNDQPNDYGYDGQTGGYDDRPIDYDYQPSNADYPPSNADYPPPPDNYDDAQSYHAAPYDGQYSDSYYPDRVPDGGAPENDGHGYLPENEPYTDGYYGDPNAHYDDGANYEPSPAHHDSYAPSFAEPPYQSPGHSYSEPHFDPDDEVSATSNPSYV